MANYQIKLTRKSILILILVLLLCILFEALQQHYYIYRFELAYDVSLWALFVGQSYRWLIWSFLSYPLYEYIRSQKQPEGYDFRFFIRLGAFILGLVAINVIIIAVIEWLNGFGVKTFAQLINEYLPFYTFQKAPIFTFGYIAVATILYLNKINGQLSFEIKSLNELQRQELQKLNKLKTEQHAENPMVLNIKVGNKRKIISVESIQYIEADDYCVKIFSAKERPYSMRASLKAMEEQLPANFLRVHRRYIVNMNSVKEFVTNHQSHMVLEDDTILPLAKSRITSFKSFYS